MNKKPLFRKENKKALNYCGDTGGEFRHIRHTKKFKEREINHLGMKGKMQRGMDYTPLFKFLLSKVGENWSIVYKEAMGRLDKEEPIYWIVAMNEKDKKDSVRIGDNTLYSGLFVDENNILQKVNPKLSINDIYPSCRCHTHSFNGKPLTNKWEDKFKLNR